MGIDIYSARFLESEARKGVVFARLLTLGHQSIYMDTEQYRTIFADFKSTKIKPEYADEFFHALGATNIDIMDVSDYEGGTVIHDLNEPVDSSFHNRYDCVFDGGALEHVFNFPMALKNCLEMVKVGGSFITITTTNNYCGHGFYQFSPELFYSVLSPANGFTLNRVLFVHRDRWYSPRTFNEVKARVLLLTDEPVLIFVSARRSEKKELFREWPQQPDYIQAWKKDSSPDLKPKDSAKKALVKIFPFLKLLQARRARYKERMRSSPQNREWFTPVNLD